MELAEDVRRALALLSRRHDAAIRLLPGTLGHALPPDEVIRNLEDDFARAAAEIERVAPKRLPARAEALRALRREIEALLEDMPRVNASPETWERPPSAAPQRHLH